MLVTFSCSAYPDITMFGDVATQLLKLMGHSGTVPGALLAEDVPPALASLEAGVAGSDSPPPPGPEGGDENGEPVVSLSRRAFPLIELMRAAAKAKVNVMWNQTG